MPILILKNGKLTKTEDSNQYTGDKVGGEFRSWDTLSTDPNRFIKESYGILSKRCATLYQTSPHARACINKPLSYAIGDGIAFKSAINAEFIGWTAKRAKKWSKKFTTLLHLDKMATGWYENQAILFREASRCGDALVYLLREDDREMPVELLVAGGHAIDWEHTVDREEGATEQWMLGIKLDKFGRRRAFWQKSTNSAVDFKDKQGNLNAIQFFFPELAGQARGYSAIHSIIAMMKQGDRMWDATIARAVTESIMMGWFNADTADVGQQIAAFADTARGKTAPSTEATTASSLVKSENMVPGGVFHLGNRESMSFSDLKTPSDNFGLLNEWILKCMAMARGYPPEFLLGEYNTSFTAHKGALNDASKKSVQERMQQVRMVERPVNLEYLRYYGATGQIEVPPGFWTNYRVRQALLEGTYLGPVPGHINPLQEVKADVEAVKASFTTPEMVATKYGRDWYNDFDEWEEQQTMWLEGSAEHRAEKMAEQERLNAEAEAGDDKKDKGADDDNKN